ncbi:PepSY domain-containing protein [Roseibium sp. CAU 1637]|uniref:PepSY domain-containing protein n=1 Tax=Roseibium limicola TaxID=2816037 RepID=A0A939J823_9HYPH|nr:PepSY-associated TM helix domain-containing protein [Roseibium limicola]MBO0343913.1 PepSY domain-containing protein [Roseibium limicola]
MKQSPGRRPFKERLQLRRALFRLHGLLGLSAGLVLALMGLSGAMMSFEDEIMAALSPQARVAVSTRALLAPDALLARVHEQRPQELITALKIESDRERAYTVTLKRRPADGGRNPRIYLDPYTGKLLGESTGAGVFARVRSFHRYLTLSGAKSEIGRHVTGVSAICLIFFALSGLYLRWPKHPFDWRSWLCIDLSLRGGSLYRALHRGMGGMVLLFYLSSALTGLWWSYDWYRQGMVSLLAPQAADALSDKSRPRTMPVARARTLNTASVDTVWTTVAARYGARLDSVEILLPRGDGPARARVLPKDASHDRAFDELRIYPRSGVLVGKTLYADLPAGPWILANMDPIHTGAVFGLTSRVLVFLASLCLPLFTLTGLLLFVRRRRAKSMR